MTDVPVDQRMNFGSNGCHVRSHRGTQVGMFIDCAFGSLEGGISLKIADVVASTSG